MQKPNRVLAFLSYLLPFVGSIVAIVADRKNAFALYHACQALAMFLAAVLLPIAWLVVAWLAAWVPLLALRLAPRPFCAGDGGIRRRGVAFGVSGLVSAAFEQYEAIDPVGKWGEALCPAYPVA